MSSQEQSKSNPKIEYVDLADVPVHLILTEAELKWLSYSTNPWADEVLNIRGEARQHNWRGPKLQQYINAVHEWRVSPQYPAELRVSQSQPTEHVKDDINANHEKEVKHFLEMLQKMRDHNLKKETPEQHAEHCKICFACGLSKFLEDFTRSQPIESVNFGFQATTLMVAAIQQRCMTTHSREERSLAYGELFLTLSDELRATENAYEWEKASSWASGLHELMEMIKGSKR